MKPTTAKELLTYLFSECTKWIEDVDGDNVNGRELVYINHHICISEGLLEELCDLAHIPREHYADTALERLKRAAETEEVKVK